MNEMRLALSAVVLLIALSLARPTPATGATYTIEGAVAVAQAQNPEIAIARKKLQAARGGMIEARSGYLPSVVSTGLFREHEYQSNTQLRNEDYNASLRIVQNLYTGGAVTSQVAIARLNLEKQNFELQAVSDRVTMNVRIAFNELLLNRAKIHVHEESVALLQEELRTQQDRLKAGMVGQLNVRRAEVALANEQTELIDAQTQLKNSYLRLGEQLGSASGPNSRTPQFEVAGQLQYEARRPDLNECLARADLQRPEIKADQIDIEIEDRQADLDKSELRPHVEVFSGYEVYNQTDPTIRPEVNYGYVVGLNAKWHIFDGFATKGRLQATRARRGAAVQALEATRISVASEVRSAFLDLQQADQVLESETKNVETADESLDIAKANLSAGLGTQLDILQATADVTRTRTTRLSAIYLHNVALGRLARACGTSSDALGSDSKATHTDAEIGSGGGSTATDVARPPKHLTQR
ncbi:MAG TPA: TolC family protein [Chthoniobacterales bacterium]|jgi:outer membrane protein TolC